MEKALRSWFNAYLLSFTFPLLHPLTNTALFDSSYISCPSTFTQHVPTWAFITRKTECVHLFLFSVSQLGLGWQRSFVFCLFVVGAHVLSAQIVCLHALLLLLPPLKLHGFGKIQVHVFDFKEEKPGHRWSIGRVSGDPPMLWLK